MGKKILVLTGSARENIFLNFNNGGFTPEIRDLQPVTGMPSRLTTVPHS